MLVSELRRNHDRPSSASAPTRGGFHQRLNRAASASVLLRYASIHLCAGVETLLFTCDHNLEPRARPQGAGGVSSFQTPEGRLWGRHAPFLERARVVAHASEL